MPSVLVLVSSAPTAGSAEQNRRTARDRVRQPVSQKRPVRVVATALERPLVASTRVPTNAGSVIEVPVPSLRSPLVAAGRMTK